MTQGMRRRWAPAALVTAVLLAVTAGCIADDSAPEPTPEASADPTPDIRLGDVSVGGTALAQRAGLYMCGRHVVASAPAGGIVGDSFAVFDLDSRKGSITDVKTPRGVHPNARWLLSTQCVDDGEGPPIISVAYQEMPLTPTGGGGIRAAYSMDGDQLWMRRDLNQPAVVVDDVLVLGATPDQPETAVDLRTGETVATFDPAVQSRTVVSGHRMVVRGLTGPPVLTTLTGKRVATLDQASFYTADGGLLFATTPAALPDNEGTGAPSSGSEPEGLTDASPSPSPTRSAGPPESRGPSGGDVRAYSLRTGRPEWEIRLAPDPLGTPTVDPRSGVAVIVDTEGEAHGIGTDSGRQLWRTPTEMPSPRVTAAHGIVLFDTLDDPVQRLVDARTGLPLPEPQVRVLDLQPAGALQIVEDRATVVPARRLRRPPRSEEPAN